MFTFVQWLVERVLELLPDANMRRSRRVEFAGQNLLRFYAAVGDVLTTGHIIVSVIETRVERPDSTDSGVLEHALAEQHFNLLDLGAATEHCVGSLQLLVGRESRALRDLLSDKANALTLLSDELRPSNPRLIVIDEVRLQDILGLAESRGASIAKRRANLDHEFSVLFGHSPSYVSTQPEPELLRRFLASDPRQALDQIEDHLELLREALLSNFELADVLPRTEIGRRRPRLDR